MDPILVNTTYTVGGTGAQYATMQAALDDLGYRPIANNVKVTLRWQSGHVPTTGIRLIGGDYSQFVISHANTASGVDANNVPLPQVTLNSSWPANTPLMFGERAALPDWNVLVNMADRSHRGIEATEGSTVRVLPNKGVLRATNDDPTTEDSAAGLYLSSGSVGTARGAVFAYCGRGLWVTRASSLDAEKANCDRCVSIGVYASRSSLVAFADGKARYVTAAAGGSGSGVVSNRSFVSANTDSGLCDVTGCSYGFCAENGGVLDASESSAANCLVRGVYSESGHIVCDTTNTTGSPVGYYVGRGGIISRYNGTGSNNQTKNVVSQNGVIYSNL